jgi:pimeloyl-ACP methyl ester carboxylesterase
MKSVASTQDGAAPKARALGVPLALRKVSSMFDTKPFAVGSFEVDGLNLYYESHGSGPRVLVFLHGLLLDAQMNRRLAGDLAEAGNRVILLDLPGHGHSDKPRHASAHRMDSYARYVVALLDELGLDDAVIGGVSLGANVALQVAVQFPDRVRGLVIEMPVLEWAVPAAAIVFLPLLLGVHYAAPVARAVAKIIRRIPRSRIGALDSFLSTLALDPEESAAVLHGMLVGPVTPTYEERHSIEVPTLVLGHKIDLVHPFTDADHLARQLPQARLVEANSIFELRVTPARLTGHISRFLDEVWNTASMRHPSRGARKDEAAN